MKNFIAIFAAGMLGLTATATATAAYAEGEGNGDPFPFHAGGIATATATAPSVAAPRVVQVEPAGRAIETAEATRAARSQL
jgi:hypothetical protein